MILQNNIKNVIEAYKRLYFFTKKYGSLSNGVGEEKKN